MCYTLMKAAILIQTQFQMVVTLKTTGDTTGSTAGTDLDREEQFKNWGKNGSGVSHSFLLWEGCLERAKPSLFFPFSPQQKSADPQSGFPVPPN